MKRNEGITLIALIITIIILIILTAITINNITSSNLFGLAQKAAENYIEAGRKEQEAINAIMSAIKGSRSEEEGGGIIPQDTLISSITLEPTSGKIIKGGTLDIIATITPEDATNQELMWTSEQTGIVDIKTSEGGKKATITGKEAGIATITVTAKDESKTSAMCTVEVQEALEVELKVDEANVTGTTIPINLEASSGNKKVQDVTYTVYLTPEGGKQEKVSITSDSHTFTGLDQTKDYTIKVVASSPDGRKAEDTIIVKALAIKYQTTYNVFQMVYRRYTDGMTWKEWVKSDYDHSVDTESVLSMVVPKNPGVLSQPNHSSCLGVEGATWAASSSIATIAWQRGVVWLVNAPKRYRL